MIENNSVKKKEVGVWVRWGFTSIILVIGLFQISINAGVWIGDINSRIEHNHDSIIEMGNDGTKESEGNKRAIAVLCKQQEMAEKRLDSIERKLDVVLQNQKNLLSELK